MSNQPSVAADHPPPTWQLLRWSSRMPAYHERLADEVTLTLLRLPAGSFWMGAPEGEEGSEDQERPVHRVTLGEFLLGQTPITQAQWRAVAEWQPREGEPAWERKLDPDPSFFKGGNRPVEQVSWLDTMEFCRRLRRRTGKHYGLPSEAQWEYACRAGTGTPFHFGETITTDLANYDGSLSFGDGPPGENRQETTAVSTFPSNAWGLHDMHGNVWEWCADDVQEITSRVRVSIIASALDTVAAAEMDTIRSSDQKTLSPKISKQAPGLALDNPDDSGGTSPRSTEDPRVERSFQRSNQDQKISLRGGSWYDHPIICTSSKRYSRLSGDRSSNIGFRVCCLPYR